MALRHFIDVTTMDLLHHPANPLDAILAPYRIIVSLFQIRPASS
jgi:hypothetical protein